MLGYQFWRQGFWKNHLQGKPYHISALYVVDLARFRRTSAGDQLRVMYATETRGMCTMGKLSSRRSK